MTAQTATSCAVMRGGTSKGLFFLADALPDDRHGHYTTAPETHTLLRHAQKHAYQHGTASPPPYPTLSDDQIRETLEQNQLRLFAQRSIDLTLFSPARPRCNTTSVMRT